MKRLFIAAAALLLLDQLLKLYISHSMPFAVLIPGLLRIFPFKNTNNGWLGGVLGYNSPLWLNIINQLAFAALSLIVHRYLTFVIKKRSHLLDAFISLGLAGASCAFIDVCVWGGSWDFMGIIDRYILDLKDIYVITAIIILIAFLISLIPYILRQTQEDKARTRFRQWIKNGLPIK